MSYTVGFAMTGSFCTFDTVIAQMEKLVQAGYAVVPILSQNAYGLDTRFGTAESFHARITALTGREIIHTIPAAEPIGPQKLLDVLIIAPCTGNTLGKLAGGITDTPVTLAAKAHLRNRRPVLIAVSSNDALSASARNIGTLLNTKRIFFVPMRQDSPVGKPESLVADFEKIPAAVAAALEERQLEPVFIEPA